VNPNPFYVIPGVHLLIVTAFPPWVRWCDLQPHYPTTRTNPWGTLKPRAFIKRVHWPSGCKNRSGVLDQAWSRRYPVHRRAGQDPLPRELPVWIFSHLVLIAGSRSGRTHRIAYCLHTTSCRR